MVEGQPTPDEAATRDVVVRVRDLVNSLPARLGPDDGFPAVAQPFRHHFRLAAQEARAVVANLEDGALLTERKSAFEELSRIFDFERFPAAAEFAAAAKGDQESCPDI